MATALVDTFGPFLIPVALFLFGLCAYWAIVALQRRGWLFQS
jgi:hypothetical protein